MGYSRKKFDKEKNNFKKGDNKQQSKENKIKPKKKYFDNDNDF